jgi:hypothetical protein
MSMYHIWNPYVSTEKPQILEFVLTSSDNDVVAKDNFFIEALLRDLGIQTSVVDWSIEPCRSKYYSEYLDSEDWRDVWQIVWNVRIIGNQKIDDLPVAKSPWLGTNATGYEWCETPDDDAVISCLVVSDFNNATDLKKAMKSIVGDELIDIRNQYQVALPTFRYFEVLGKYKQLQIDLGKFSGSFFSGESDYAQQVMDLCKKAKGKVHFDHD